MTLESSARVAVRAVVVTCEALGMKSRSAPRQPVAPVSMPEALGVVDLFCGAGGLAQGFAQAGFRISAGLDHDPDAMATFHRNFSDAVSLTGDIRTSQMRERLRDAAGESAVVVGGPPCQAFSQVRNHTRIIDDPRNSLYREFVSVVNELRPRAFVMENVPGLAQMGVREQVVQDLQLDGNYLVRPQLVDASDYGVPQARKRLLFLGVRQDLGVEPPQLEGSGASAALTLLRESVDVGGYRLGLRNDVVAEELLARLRDNQDMSIVSVRQAIGDLEGLEVGRREDEYALTSPTSAYQVLMRSGQASAVNCSVPRMNRDTLLRLEGIPAGGNYRDLAENLRARYLTGQKWGPSTDSDQLARKHYYAYRRLHPDLWAWTLNTKADAVYHYSVARALSVREFLRLQSFPDSFVVTTDSRRGEILGRIPNGATHSKYRQIGNAVPPLLAQAIAESISQVLDLAKKPSLA